MHSDEVAKRYGFRGGLVPGVTVFGYLAQVFEDDQGPEWQSQGWGELRLIRPFYDGETVVVRGEPSMGGWALSAEGDDGGVRATLRLGLRNNAALPVTPPDQPLPEPRPPASEDSLAPETILGSITKVLHDASPREMLEAANHILMANFILEPWIHTASKLQWFRPPRTGETIEVRAAIDDLFARKGHSMVRYTVAYLAEDGPVLNVDHTVIWHLEEK
jgi:acyl dehydratase